MNTYYIASKDAFLSHIDWFHPQLGAHYIDLPNGQILVSASFPANHSSIEIWEAKASVQTLPHPVFEGTKKLDPQHIAALASLGITPAHTVIDVAKAAGAISPLLKLRSF